MVERLTKSWHREEIKAAVRMRGWTLTSLSLYWGMPESACRVALLRPYYAAELAIAEAIGESPRALWPHRYRDNGQPLNPRKSKLTRPRRPMHGQNERTVLTEPKGQA